MRYRLPSGKDSRKVGPASQKKGRPPHGYLTEGEALVKAEAFSAEHSTVPTSTRGTFRSGLDAFFGTHPASPALGWAWMPPKVESEGKLRFYAPEQAERLIA
jgi:hypothetical protein